jgi:hypothetical protein
VHRFVIIVKLRVAAKSISNGKLRNRIQVSAFNPTVRVHNHGRVILLQDDAAHKIDRFTYVASKNTRSC